MIYMRWRNGKIEEQLTSTTFHATVYMKLVYSLGLTAVWEQQDLSQHPPSLLHALHLRSSFAVRFMQTTYWLLCLFELFVQLSSLLDRLSKSYLGRAA